MTPHISLRVVVVTAAIAAAAVVASAPLSGQAMFNRENTPRQPRAPSWLAEKATLLPLEVGRTPWGEPDFRGVFGTEGVSSDNIESVEDWLDPATPPTETFIVDPADGKVPYQPWALAERGRFRAGLARGWPNESGERLHMDPQTFCMTGIPRIAWRSAWQIMQVPGYVIVNIGWGHFYRVIPTDGRPSTLDPSVKLWLGHSRGRWEGNTFVVEVTHLNGRQWFDSYANFYSENARMVERWTLVKTRRPQGGERVSIDWQVTVDDPTVFTRPWTMNLPLRRQDADEQWEHACHEGNAHHIEGAAALGFLWFRGVTPPSTARPR